MRLLSRLKPRRSTWAPPRRMDTQTKKPYSAIESQQHLAANSQKPVHKTVIADKPMIFHRFSYYYIIRMYVDA